MDMLSYLFIKAFCAVIGQSFFTHSSKGQNRSPKRPKFEKNQTILNLKTFFGGSIVVAEKCGRENTTTIKAGTACENGSGMGTYKYGRSIWVQLVVAWADALGPTVTVLTGTWRALKLRAFTITCVSSRLESDHEMPFPQYCQCIFRHSKLSPSA